MESRALTNLQKARLRLEENLFNKFDVVVSMQKPQVLMQTDKSDQLFINDLGATFAYPSLTVPIGFTNNGGETRFPVGAYFVTTPEKMPLMLSVAKRYEDVFWYPKMPDNF